MVRSRCKRRRQGLLVWYAGDCELQQVSTSGDLIGHKQVEDGDKGGCELQVYVGPMRRFVVLVCICVGVTQMNAVSERGHVGTEGYDEWDGRSGRQTACAVQQRLGSRDTIAPLIDDTAETPCWKKSDMRRQNSLNARQSCVTRRGTLQSRHGGCCPSKMALGLCRA